MAKPTDANGNSIMNILVALLASTISAAAATPDCSGPDSWSSNMAFTYLKNAGLVNNDQLDFAKTKSAKVAYEKIGRDLYRQVHLVTFQRKDGTSVEAITVNDASSEECAMGDTQIFVISQKMGAFPKAPY